MKLFALIALISVTTLVGCGGPGASGTDGYYAPAPATSADRAADLQSEMGSIVRDRRF